MKIKASILSGVVATLFLSVGTERAGISEGFQIGDYAPAIILPEFGGRAIDFREHAGQYTLVNFWAAYDAESRIRNIQLRNSVKELDSSLLAVHSISMDERKSVFEGTLKADGLERTNQWNDQQGKASALYKMYGLEKGLRNFLIDDKGVIIGVDLSPREVIRIVTGNHVVKTKTIANDRKELSHRIRRDNSFLFLGTSLPFAHVLRGRDQRNLLTNSSINASRNDGCAMAIRLRARSRNVFAFKCAMPYSVTT